MAIHHYKGERVTKIRDAKEGDPGFDPKGGNQILVLLADGKTQKVVKWEELIRS